MRFFVIYDFDITREQSVERYKPPHARRLWDLTETDECYEFDYLADEGSGEDYERFRNGKHRKYVAELSREEFEEFLHSTGLWADDTPTMGSLTGFGWMPAISFRGENYHYDHHLVWQSAYVTPLPEVSNPEKLDERAWERVERAVLATYGV